MPGGGTWRDTEPAGGKGAQVRGWSGWGDPSNFRGRKTAEDLEEDGKSGSRVWGLHVETKGTQVTCRRGAKEETIRQ